MGIFSKLFGKKKPVSTAPRTLPPLDPILQRKPSEDELIEADIVKNPLSAEFRLPVQQNEANMNTMEYIDFYTKSCGNFVAIDFETTGLDPQSEQIVEIGAVKVECGQIVDRFHQYVNPGKPMPAEAAAVNHITDSMLADNPRIYQVLPDLLHFIGSDILVAHNAAFDFKFLAVACMRYRFRIPSLWFDSMDLRLLWPDLKSKKMQAFLDAAGIENSQAHSAAGDADALARLMIFAMQKKCNVQLPPDFDFGFSVGHFSDPVEKVDNALSGKRFVITGEIVGHERYDVEKLICLHGGKATLKISNATDYLVVGVFRNLPPFYVSAKEVFAEKLISEGGKIKLITPAELFAMMNEVL